MAILKLCLRFLTSRLPCASSRCLIRFSFVFRHREKYARAISEHDVIVSDIPQVGAAEAMDDQHFPYVGNGMIGNAVLYEPDGASSLFLYYKSPNKKSTKLIE